MSTRTIKHRFPGLVASVLLLGLVACQTSPPPAESEAPATPGVFAIPSGATEYAVNAQDSKLLILVYRGGPMAKLGHNHVIASHHLGGTVYVTEDPLRTRFDISLPVSELTVDEPAMREQSGPDFTNVVPQGARDGTRTNMLSPALLDGANYPTIRLRALDAAAASAATAGASYDVGVEITIKDQVRTVRVPVSLRREDGAVIASGEFPLKQSDLGLKPFTAAMGALAVVDEMRVRFEVVARR